MQRENHIRDVMDKNATGKHTVMVQSALPSQTYMHVFLMNQPITILPCIMTLPCSLKPRELASAL